MWMGSEVVTMEDLIEMCCKAIVYGSNRDTRNLNMLRYEQYVRKRASAETKCDIDRLPSNFECICSP